MLVQRHSFNYSRAPSSEKYLFYEYCPLKIHGHKNENKNAFSIYACLLKKKVGFLITLTTSGKNRSLPN